jgi:hypothetical protein
MTQSKLSRIVKARGRKIAGEFLKIADHPSNLLDDLPDIVRQVTEQVEAVLPALVETLEQGKPNAKALAAWFILYTEAESPAFIEDGKWVVDAKNALSEVLRQGSADERFRACALMALAGIPGWAVPALRICLEERDERIQTCAAAALAIGNDGDFWIFQILERALHGNDPLLVTVAAQGFARSGMRRKECIATLVSLLEKVSEESQYQIMLSLREIGPGAAASVPSLLRILQNQNAHAANRGIAATALGAVTKGTTRAIPALMKTLYENEWRIVDGVVRALVWLGHIPDEVIQRLSSLLSSEDLEMRVTAANGLASIKERAAAAVPALIARVGLESNARASFSLSDALAAIGTPAVPAILEVIRSGDMLRVGAMAVALKHMGIDGVTALISALETPNEPWVIALLIQILREIGSFAAPAVPLLARMLEETDDEEFATYLVTAILATGPAARGAIGPLVRVVLEENDELAWWGTQALWSVGPDAIPQLEAALRTADVHGQDRIHRTLAGLREKTDKRFARLENVKDDNLLETFSHIAKVLLSSEHGELSWPRIAQILNEELGSGRINGDKLRTSTTDLRRKTKDLEKRLKVKLTTHKPSGRTGGLTDKARGLLPLIREYLQSKELRRIDKQ